MSARPATSRTAVLVAPRRFELRQVARPDPGPCSRYPLTIGEPVHEGWGTVTAVGAGVGGAREGDCVALPSTASLVEEELTPAELAVPRLAALAGLPHDGGAPGGVREGGGGAM